MDEMMMKMLRDSIDVIRFYRVFILYLDNRISENMVVIILLEGICYCTTGVGANSYFQEVEQRLNSVILVEEDRKWVIPTEDDKLNQIFMYNVVACTVITIIDELNDTVFHHHYDDGLRRNKFQKCMSISLKIIEKLI